MWNTNQRLSVWHTWDGDDAAVLETILDEFAKVYPNVTLSVQRANLTDEAVSDYELQAEAGLGPDLLIGIEDPDMVALYRAGLTADLASYLDPASIDERLLANSQLGDALLGIPFSAKTTVVYYNPELVDASPQTLDDLILIADTEQFVAIDIDPLISLWGIYASGGQFYDAKGDFAFNQDDAYSAWLTWLDAASRHAYILLSDDYETLLTQFREGAVGVLIGSSSDYPDLIETMGEELVGVAPLPLGVGSALLLESIVVNRASANTELAVDLIEFITNDAQQRTLAIADLSLTAVNLTESLDHRMFNYGATLQNLVAASEPLPINKGVTTSHALDMIRLLNRQLLDGILDPAEAADELEQSMSDFVNLSN